MYTNIIKKKFESRTLQTREMKKFPLFSEHTSYLWGVHFELITDHKSLTFLCTCQYHSMRVQRWILSLQQYDFEVGYCRGKDNEVADVFSRNPEGRF